MQCIILAGGLGSRLSEETSILPKPLVKIGPSPIIFHIMRYLSQFDIYDFVICGGYLVEHLKDYFSKLPFMERDYRISYANLGSTIFLGQNEFISKLSVTLIDTGLETNTAGRLKAVQDSIEGDEFFFTYGDGLCDFDLQKVFDRHKRGSELVTISLARQQERFGVVEVGPNGNVKEFKEKGVIRSLTDSDFGYVNAGYAMMNKRIFEFIKSDCSLESEIFPLLAQQNLLAGVKFDGFFKPMDTLKEKQELEAAYFSGSCPWIVPD